MKFSGKIGYRTTIDKGHGVWVEDIVERTYKGDITRNSYRNQQGENINDDLTISNNVSIVAQDKFTLSNIASIIYCEWNDIKWKVTSVDVQYPRLILSLGGVYHE